MLKGNKYAVYILVTAYIAALTLANIAVVHWGPWASPVNSFFFIGFSFVARDVLHEVWRTPRVRIRNMLLMILVAGGLSLFVHIDAGRIALASSLSFVLAETLDWLTYSSLNRFKFLVRSNGSNVVGNIADSILFPVIAFGNIPALAAVIGAQFLAKVFGGFLWSLAINRFINPDKLRKELAQD